MEVTGSTAAAPITTLEELKVATKTVRTGTDAQVDALYSHVLSTMSWYYTQFNASDKHEYATKRNWKEAMLQLSGKGISDPHMFANMLLKKSENRVRSENRSQMVQGSRRIRASMVRWGFLAVVSGWRAFLPAPAVRLPAAAAAARPKTAEPTPK